MKKLLLLLTLTFITVSITSCSQYSRSAKKQELKNSKGYTVVFAETGDTSWNVTEERVKTLITNPPEDMIIYLDGKVYKTIVE